MIHNIFLNPERRENVTVVLELLSNFFTSCLAPSFHLGLTPATRMDLLLQNSLLATFLSSTELPYFSLQNLQTLSLHQIFRCNARSSLALNIFMFTGAYFIWPQKLPTRILQPYTQVIIFGEFLIISRTINDLILLTIFEALTIPKVFDHFKNLQIVRKSTLAKRLLEINSYSYFLTRNPSWKPSR